MNEMAKQLDDFAIDFFKEIKLQFKTTDINIIGNVVELPVNSQLVKICLLFTRMYVDKFHNEINRDSLNEALIKMKKPILVTDSIKHTIEKGKYNRVLDEVLELIT